MNNIILCFIACMTILNACTLRKYIYSPATINLLQLKKKNDLKMAVGFATTGRLLSGSFEEKKSDGVDVQTAYAINEKIAIRLSSYSKWESTQSIFKVQNNGLSDIITYKKQGIEISGGYYNFSKNKTESVFQVYAGTGIGKFTLNESDTAKKMNYHTMNYFKFFVQSVLSERIFKNYLMCISPGFSLFKYNNINTNYIGLDKQVLGYIGQKPSVFFNFILHNEIGFEKLPGIEFQWQTGITSLLTKFSSQNQMLSKDQYDYNNVWLAVGIIAYVNKLFLQNKKK